MGSKALRADFAAAARLFGFAIGNHRLAGDGALADGYQDAPDWEARFFTAARTKTAATRPYPALPASPFDRER